MDEHQISDKVRQMRYELNRLRFEHYEALTRRRDMIKSVWRWLPRRRMALKLLDMYLDGMESEIKDLTLKIHDWKYQEK